MAETRFGSSPRMSQAVVGGGLVFTAGQVATGATVEAQTEAVLGQIDALLAQAGTSKQRLVSASVWLADMNDFAAMNAVWDRWVAPGAAPARATVGATLAAPEFKVEIAVVAALD